MCQIKYKLQYQINKYIKLYQYSILRQKLFNKWEKDWLEWALNNTNLMKAAVYKCFIGLLFGTFYQDFWENTWDGVPFFGKVTGQKTSIIDVFPRNFQNFWRYLILKSTSLVNGDLALLLTAIRKKEIL